MNSKLNSFVSVVVPTHHRPDLLESILGHLNQQTYKADCFEVIVVSTPEDETKRVVKILSPNLRYRLTHSHVPNDETAGKDVSAKRSHGASLARGEWLAFLDNDMRPEPEWMQEASCFFEDKNVGGIEGQTLIEDIDKPTLTYKGLQRVKEPGGYQSCNIFFRKSDFMRTEGYSKEFPWYLEDTDAAWAILGLGKKIVFAEKARAFHPVPPAAPWRLFHETKSAILVPKLYKRHKEIYKEKKMTILRKSHYAYLLGQVGFLASALLLSSSGIMFFSFYLIALLALHSFKMFFGCQFTYKEFYQTLYYIFIAPPILFVQALRGARQQQLKKEEVIYLLKP